MIHTLEHDPHAMALLILAILLTGLSGGALLAGVIWRPTPEQMDTFGPVIAIPDAPHVVYGLNADWGFGWAKEWPPAPSAKVVSINATRVVSRR